MLAQCVQNGLQDLSAIARGKERLIWERPRYIQRYLTLIAEIALFPLHSHVQCSTLLVVDVLVGALLDQVQPLHRISAQHVLAAIVAHLVAIAV